MLFGLHRDVTEQKQAEDLLNEKRKRLTAMAIELSLAEERERIRIASELHDQIGQALILVKIKLSMQDKMLPSAEYDHERASLYELLDQIIHNVRSLTVQLSPPLLAGAGLETALEYLAKQMKTDYDLLVEFDDDRCEKPLTEELRSVIYQSARELLINVAKHADTDSAKLIIGRDDMMLCLRVEDCGNGFDAGASVLNSAMNCSFGLFNIQQRMECLGGEMILLSSPGKGTSVTIQMPLSLR